MNKEVTSKSISQVAYVCQPWIANSQLKHNTQFQIQKS